MTDNKLADEYRKAIIDNNVEKFSKILAEDNDIIKAPTLLHLAAKENSVEIVKLLLGRHDVSVNQRNDDGQTALHVASCEGHAEMVSELLHSENIQVNAKDKNGDTPLHLAVIDDCRKSKNSKVIKLLIEHHADLGSRNNKEFLPNFSEEEYKKMFPEQIRPVSIGNLFGIL